MIIYLMKATVSPSHYENEGKLSVWTVAGIIFITIGVVLILVIVLYKKVIKQYRTGNPHKTLEK